MRPSESLRATSERIDRVAPVLVARLADMTAAQLGWPSSSSVDAPSAPSKTTFCELHGKERCECGGGTPFANLSDPTGEAAMRPDKAARHRAEVESILRRMDRDSARLEQLVALYGPRQATDTERTETRNGKDRADGCASCARTEVARGVPRWEPASRSVLMPDGERRPLCSWCRQWFADFGRLPSIDELRQRHSTGRVKRPA